MGIIQMEMMKSFKTGYVKKIFFGYTTIEQTVVNLGLLIIRVSAGLSMAFGHGIKKLPPSEGFINGVSKLGLPLPEFMAWAASLSEFAGGLLIVIGVATRPSAFFLCITMGVAAFIRHGGDPFGSMEKALLYFFIFLMLCFTGAGKYSADHQIHHYL